MEFSFFFRREAAIWTDSLDKRTKLRTGYETWCVGSRKSVQGRFAHGSCETDIQI
jgi:hypothetical protein